MSNNIMQRTQQQQQQGTLQNKISAETESISRNNNTHVGVQQPPLVGLPVPRSKTMEQQQQQQLVEEQVSAAGAAPPAASGAAASAQPASPSLTSDDFILHQIRNPVSQLKAAALATNDPKRVFKGAANGFQLNFFQQHAHQHSWLHVPCPGLVQGKVVPLSVARSRGVVAEECERLFYDHIVLKPLADLSSSGAVTVVPYPTHGLHTETMYAEIVKQHMSVNRSSSSSSNNSSIERPSGTTALFLGALPCKVTVEQILAVLVIFTGVAPSDIKLHRHAHRKERYDATSAWVLVPAHEAQRIIDILDKRVIFDNVGWIYGNDQLVFRAACELLKYDENARYQRMPHAPMTVAFAVSGPQQEQQQPHVILHDPLCHGCSNGDLHRRPDDFLNFYMDTFAYLCYDITNVPALHVHSNCSEHHVIDWNAVNKSNQRFRECWAHARSVGPKSCDAHRNTDADAVYHYEFETVWAMMQKELRAARYEVQEASMW